MKHSLGLEGGCSLPAILGAAAEWLTASAIAVWPECEFARWWCLAGHSAAVRCVLNETRTSVRAKMRRIRTCVKGRAPENRAANFAAAGRAMQVTIPLPGVAVQGAAARNAWTRS